MGWFQIIVAAVTNLPKIVAIVRSIIDLIGQIHPSQQPQALVDLAAAYKTAAGTGNTTQLAEVHSRICSGVGCAPDIVK